MGARGGASGGASGGGCAVGENGGSGGHKLFTAASFLWKSAASHRLSSLPNIMNQP